VKSRLKIDCRFPLANSARQGKKVIVCPHETVTRSNSQAPRA